MQHPYEKIPLNTAGLVLAAFIIGLHLWMLLKQHDAMDYLKKFSRNYVAGVIFMAIGLIWFWLIVMPGYSPIEMELNDFNKAKPMLLFIVPLGGYFIITQMKEFLAVRGLGLVCLMAAAPLLAASWQEPHPYKLLVPIYAYAMIIKGLIWVSMPYLFRDAINWATASKERFKMLTIAGLVYGVAVLACSIVFWG